jgi:hypothetical protein
LDRTIGYSLDCANPVGLAIRGWIPAHFHGSDQLRRGWVKPFRCLRPELTRLSTTLDAYEVYAASAMGATSAARSVFGVVLPFATRPMYSRLGVDWACTLLGILSALMCLIPFVFIKYGEKIRARSKFCQELKVLKAQNEESERRRWDRQRSQQEASDLEKGR